MTNEQYIIENFRKMFDATHTITVTYRDDETIHVDVRRDDVCNAQFVMNVSSDDDEMRFVDVDNNFPDIEFPIQRLLVINNDDLPDAITMQFTHLASLMTDNMCTRLATMSTDDDDYFPATMRVLALLLDAKHDMTMPDVHEIDVSNEPNLIDAITSTFHDRFVK